jgi:adenylate kinase
MGTFGSFAAAQDATAAPQQTIVILMGPPGSGKGTQAARLTKDLSIPHISTGDLFRENMNQKTPLGEKAKGFINDGKLVPDELVIDMLKDRISRPDCVKGYLLDGFPRTLPQAEAYESLVPRGVHVIVLNLDVPDDVIVKRIEGRRSCKNCGNIHNIYFSAPAKEGICDKCGGALSQRADDNAEVVQERLRVYHSQTKPLIAYYEKKGLLHTVDGTEAPDVIFQKLLKLVRE